MQTQSARRSLLPALASVLIWATLSTVGKLVLQGLPDLETLGISSAFAFVFMAAALVVTGKYKLLKTYSLRQYAVMAGLGFLGLFVYSALYYFGLGRLPAGEACILNYLWPVMLVLFSCVILKEKLTVKKAAALLLSFAGAAILSLGGAETGAPGRWPGMAACVGAAACYGLYCVLNKKCDFDQTVMMTAVWLTVALCCFLLGPLTERWVPVRGWQWPGLGWLGVFVNAVAYLTWGVALQRAQGTAAVANLAYAVPFLSLLLSALVLKEKITLAAAAALVLIVGGILLQSVPARRKKTS